MWSGSQILLVRWVHVTVAFINLYENQGFELGKILIVLVTCRSKIIGGFMYSFNHRSRRSEIEVLE